MNRQRIEELAVQSGLAQAADVRAGFIFPPGMEKFAELLIQECARAVDKVYEDAEPDHGCYDWATWAEGADVLKHFGVE
jgi:hypothetical protein